MATRNKLQKFAEILQLPNVYENFDPRNPELVGEGGLPVDRKGNWAQGHFGNDNPITLELACGRGEYTVDLAGQYPDRSFIGVDIKGARIWKGAKIAIERKLENAAFLRTRIEIISTFFAPGEVDEIWITFPDPFLKKGKENRRLTAARYLKQYRHILKPGGLVHLKTDSRELYEWTQETFAEQPAVEVLYHDHDIYSKPLPIPELSTETYYEKLHKGLGKTITYTQFRFGPEDVEIIGGKGVPGQELK
ncbi:tRNA (guanosine(46)-N7)-methyltransferase TrmB [Neolewinella aurantiaca]|uniref:tRNA (guanine-N(7)-)-methyltransferase n=1 Tax=Neolewinella aurantiaca TaxID=2602767 RepID=A0A5C7FQI9_9BACT|nr:tRNA (guanosine(46)-N7)-methyltransferase TrmB [Neolewinella aurantiaca]TXF88706.1 tRNA (guanosine(46)-N7)-methyltransferase TrmB [Neolewinella aurantiaca]